MQIKPGVEKEYEEYKEKNSKDGYSLAVVTYTERWADLMEKAMAERNIPVEECAEACSREANTEGITGFMYGYAVQALGHYWKHGEALATWHNRQYMKDPEEAAKAALDGKTVNPAILTIG